MYKSLITMLIAMFASVTVLTGCETIEGAGQDIQNAGEVVEDAADEDGRY